MTCATRGREEDVKGSLELSTRTAGTMRPDRVDGDEHVAGVRNLTQVEAAERARLLEVTAYDISLDLTDGGGVPGRAHVPVGHRGPVHAAPSRAPAPSSRSPPSRCARPRSTAPPVDISGWRAEQRPGPARPGRRQRAGRRRRLRVLRHRPGPAPHGRPGRQGGLPLQPVRDRRRPARVRLLRPARPQGGFTWHVTVPSALAGRSRTCRSTRRGAPPRRARPSTSSGRRG